MKLLDPVLRSSFHEICLNVYFKHFRANSLNLRYYLLLIHVKCGNFGKYLIMPYNFGLRVLQQLEMLM